MREQGTRLDDLRGLRDGFRKRPGGDGAEQRQPADAERMASLRREPHDARAPLRAAAEDFHEAVARHFLERRREAAFSREAERFQQVGDKAGAFLPFKIRQRAGHAHLGGGEVLAGGSWHFIVK